MGHQAIGLVSRASAGSSRSIMHGKASVIKHDGEGLYKGLPEKVTVNRFHSLAVHEETLPDTLVVTSRSLADRDIMGLPLVDSQAAIDRLLEHHHSSFIAWDRVHQNHIGSYAIAKAWMDSLGLD